MIRRGDLESYLTDDLYEAIDIWKRYTRFGLFHGSGEAAETDEYITLISAFEDEREAAIADRRNK
nr:hypothetical protein [uncultured Sphaerochaeta sp.]